MNQAVTLCFVCKMDMFQDLFGNSDSEEEFYGFELSDDEVKDGADINERDEGEPIRAEDLEWSREASFLSPPDFTPFFGLVNLPAVQTALGFVLLFFRVEVLQHIVEQTNLYTSQENADKEEKDPDWFNEDGKANKLSIEELKAFLGVQVMMRIVQPPMLHSYWNEKEPFLYQAEIAKVFPRNQFLAILRYLHFNNNTKLSDRYFLCTKESWTTSCTASSW